MMKTGMSTACFFGRELNEDALCRIGKLGIRDAEVFFSAGMEYKPQFIEELKRISDGEGVQVRSVHAFTTQFEPQLASTHPRQFEEALATYYEVLSAAARLGAHIYVFHGPIYLKTARKLNVNYEWCGKRFSMLADIAAEFGVTLCYETVHWCWYQTPDFAEKLLPFVTSDNLGFTLDMKQVAQSGYEPAEYIDRMEGRLRHVHVCDFVRDPEKGIAPVLPMQGEAPWGQIRDKLHEVGYDGYLMLEVYTMNWDTEGMLMESYESVKDFFA